MKSSFFLRIADFETMYVNIALRALNSPSIGIVL